MAEPKTTGLAGYVAALSQALGKGKKKKKGPQILNPNTRKQLGQTGS
jgi:hypothetical protein